MAQLRIFIILCCFYALNIAEESLPEDFDVQSFIDSKEKEQVTEPFDHSSFLKLDDTQDLHIPNSKRSKAKLRQILKKIDVDNDEKISNQELGDWVEKVMNTFLITEGENQLPKIDRDGDGLVTWEEYALAAGYTQGDKPEPKTSSDSSKQHDKEKFDLSDTNHDSKLSTYELGVMVHPNEAPQMSNIIVTEFLEGMDKDKDNKISLNEFMGDDPSMPTIDERAKSEMGVSFKKLDHDKDGVLNMNELKSWLMPDSKSPFRYEADYLIEDLDKNKDGFLTEKEIFYYYEKFATSRATRYGRMLKEQDEIKENKPKEKKDGEPAEDNKTTKKKVDDEL